METKLEKMMGNLLCKKSRGDSPISPVDRVIGRCAQICPQNIGKKKHFWDKQVLETSPPPLRQQPKLDTPIKEGQQTGWETATLTVPDSPGNGIVPPVAPPRKKRSSMSPKKDCSKRGENNTNLDCDKESNEEMNSQKMEEQKIQDNKANSEEGLSTPTKIVSDVGNKKSDKFFGEQISDTSTDGSPSEEEKKEVLISQADKPILDKDEVDNVKQPEQIVVHEKDIKSDIEVLEESDEMLRKISKETGNLIFALEKQLNPQENPDYEGQTPVVEEIIVPVKRKPRHICDDEDCLRKLLHNTSAPDSNAPKKPQRDFTKYKKSLENVKSQEISDSSQNQKPTEQKEGTGSTQLDENTVAVEQNDVTGQIECPQDLTSETKTIPIGEAEEGSPPPIPPKLKRKSESPIAGSVSETSERLKRKSESVPPNMSHSEKILRRCLSSQSYLTPELVEKIAEQANSLSLTALYLPEDCYSSCNDGSGLVSPYYKLSEKRKLSSQASRTSQAQSEDEIAGHSQPTNEQQNVKADTISVERAISEPPKDVTKEKTKDLSKEQSQEVAAEIDVRTSHVPSESVIVENIQINGSDEGHVERKLKKRISVNSSSPEEVSKTIQSFLSKDDLTPKSVLKLLEDEFGDVINSKSLAPEDKKAIEDLRKTAAAIEDSSIQSHNVENSELTPKQHDSENESEIAQNKTATLESNAKLTKPHQSHHYSKIPKLKNKALDNIESGEKRRHSIDELESWFSPKSDKTEVKRRREASLPNCLDSPDPKNTQFFSDTSDSSKNVTKKPTDSTNEHSSLLKFLEKERDNHLT